MLKRRAAVFWLVVSAVVVGIDCHGHYKGVEVETVRFEGSREIEGVPCRDSAKLDEEGRLLSCTLSRDAALGEAALPAGTWIRFDPTGAIEYCFLPGTTRIQGHLCRGKGHGYMTTFHPSGRLRLCWLAEDEEIQGIPCVKANVSGEIFGRLAGRGGPGVLFHENGKLESCKAAATVTIDGETIERGRRVSLGPEGNLVRR